MFMVHCRFLRRQIAASRALGVDCRSAAFTDIIIPVVLNIMVIIVFSLFVSVLLLFIAFCSPSSFMLPEDCPVDARITALHAQLRCFRLSFMPSPCQASKDDDPPGLDKHRPLAADTT